MCGVPYRIKRMRNLELLWKITTMALIGRDLNSAVVSATRSLFESTSGTKDGVQL